MKKILILLIFITIKSIGYSQEKDNTIDQQFQELIDGSNNYQDYKVIKKSKIIDLQNTIKDTITKLKNEIETAYLEIERQKSETITLTQRLTSSETNLIASQQKENGIETFGLLMNKSLYNLVMLSIIMVLFVILGYLFFKFKSSHTITKETQLKLKEIEEKFDAHRTKSLEENQLLGRKLQDEINKKKKT